MATEKPITPWENLFDPNGVPLTDFNATIETNKIPLSEHQQIQHSQHLHENSFLFWNRQSPVKIHKPTNNSRSFLDAHVKKINGSIHEYTFAGVQLPTKNSDLIMKKLRLYIKREQRRDPFGEWLWQQIHQKKYSVHMLANMIANIRFDLVYVKNPETGKVQQLDFPVRRDDGGLYFVQENDAATCYKEIVYVGKSLRAMRTTIWCHFHNWKGKYSYTNPKDGRGEDRGQWIEKIESGKCTYSIGTIRVLPRHEGFPGITDQDVRILEKVFIHLLDPRDNKLDKIIHPDDAQTSLFETVFDAHNEILNQNNNPNDDLPF